MNEDLEEIPSDLRNEKGAALGLSDMERTLIALQNVSSKQRRLLIKDLELEGNQVLFGNGIYTIIDTRQESHRLSKKRCPQCQEMKLLSDFMGQKLIQVWCLLCRQTYPVEAKRAQDRNYQKQYPLEKQRAKWAKEKEQHPGWKHRSESHLQKKAADLASSLLLEVSGEAIEGLEEDYEPYQRRKIQEYLKEIIMLVEQYPSQKKREERMAEGLREQAQALLKRANALSHENSL